jgi:hypothetical protein
MAERERRMSTLRTVDHTAWESTQKKTFTRWLNSLGVHDVTINDLESDFGASPQTLVHVVEHVGKHRDPAFSVGRYARNPRSHAQIVETLALACNHIRSFAASNGADVTFSPADVLERKTKMILGMMWAMIRYFGQVSDSELASWVTTHFASQGTSQTSLHSPSGHSASCDFSRTFRHGAPFLRIMASYDPSIATVETPSDPLASLNVAFDIAEQRFAVPRLLDAEEIVATGVVDDKSVITYLSTMRTALEEYRTVQENQKAVDSAQSAEEPQKDDLHSVAEDASTAVEATSSDHGLMVPVDETVAAPMSASTEDQEAVSDHTATSEENSGLVLQIPPLEISVSPSASPSPPQQPQQPEEEDLLEAGRRQREALRRHLASTLFTDDQKRMLVQTYFGTSVRQACLAYCYRSARFDVLGEIMDDERNFTLHFGDDRFAEKITG